MSSISFAGVSSGVQTDALVSAILGFVVLFEDVERVAMVQLHADGAEDGAYRARGAPLFADDLADVVRRDPQLQDRVIVAVDGCDFDCRRLIDQGDSDLPDQFSH